MSWKLLILDKAEENLAWFRKYQKKYYVRCFDLIRKLAQHPRTGAGKPERLKYFDREVWSRRISHEHRLVYVIYAQEEEIDIVACKSHYAGLI